MASNAWAILFAHDITRAGGGGGLYSAAGNLVNDHLATVVILLKAADSATRVANLLVVMPHLVSTKLAVRGSADEDAATISKRRSIAHASIGEGAPVFIFSDVFLISFNIVNS